MEASWITWRPSSLRELIRSSLAKQICYWAHSQKWWHPDRFIW